VHMYVVVRGFFWRGALKWRIFGGGGGLKGRSLGIGLALGWVSGFQGRVPPSLPH